MRHRYPLLAAAACLAASLTAVDGPPAFALNTTEAICADGTYYDGVDTRPSASECMTALSDAGYAPIAFSNRDAEEAAGRVETTAIFYHAGHALVTCSDPAATNCTAMASVFAPSAPPTGSPTDRLTTLLGDLQGAELQGTAKICPADGQEITLDTGLGTCRSVVLTQYPYETAFTRINLAVFDSCESAHDGVNGFTSLATEAFDNFAGTAIGWRKAIAGRDEFSRRFFSDLDDGQATYYNALVDAANNAGPATRNYTSYVYKHRSGAPTTLRPASFYVGAANLSEAF
ncbi:MAG: hypothetical protein QOC82_646 [Frankiaceae bacterium]|jgi:hypothetical protein|nr:hypothetical protein [Frankiaceae bacterium]